MKLTHFIILSLLLLLTACSRPYERISGDTMGTQYHIAYSRAEADRELIQATVEQLLNKVNQQMSTYIENSKLSQLNRSDSLECIPLPKELLAVIAEAKNIHAFSNGAFDPSLAPLIELWGFDKKNTRDRIPSDNAIQQAQKQMHFDKVTIDTSRNCLTKPTPDTSINLSAIAKGYAVDEIAKLLEQGYGVQNYLVDIGGEIKAKGQSAKKRPWRVAIEVPDAQQRKVQKVISPGIMGVATSGDYRNYFEKDGQRYSHTIDPVTGRPITHTLASVTVLHESAMTADALATAFMVLGPERSMALAAQHNIAVYIITKTDSGFKAEYSDSFNPYLTKVSMQ
ncbi:FAD:protein FMN transferase [Pleionea sp. CnH1-48]|uniref:FAD:protein FMN transferase n=1 Tax=Pleionea sp. CnH1-48 TaxID=2954494 RepID=UPI0020970FA4|nr:FAD:protein FMN transferase [Pleionea sp. CnH1-48]MCO7225080.1 FAD:protein FMN transferase [Pleionea sp. CnH1-48]